MQLGDIASLGGGFLGAVNSQLSLGLRLRALLQAEDDRKQGRQLQALRLIASNPEMADRTGAIFGEDAAVPGMDTTAIAQQARDADTAISAFRTSGDVKALQTAAQTNPYIARRIKGDAVLERAINTAVERGEDATAHAQWVADTEALVKTGVPRQEAMRQAAAKSPAARRIFAKEGRHLLAPEATPYQQWQMDPLAQGGMTRSRERNRVLGGIEALDTPLGGLGDVMDAASGATPRDTFGLPVFTARPNPFAEAPGMAPAPAGAPAARPRTAGDRKADQVRREAEARVTDVDRERLGLERTRVDLQRRGVVVAEGRESRLVTRDKEVRERLGATLKTLEAQAIDIAKKVFPDDLVKQRALTERLHYRLKGIGALANSDKTLAELEADINKEIAAAKGEISDLGEGAEQAGGWWDKAARMIRGLAAGPAAEVPRALPGRAAPKEPAPTQPAQSEGFDSLPPAAQYKDRTVKDTVTGKRYKSDGQRWIEVP